MNKSVTITWSDEDNPESYILALKWYGLTLLNEVAVNVTDTEITLYGTKEAIDNFMSDFENGTCEPMNGISTGLEDDDDYQAWLDNEIVIALRDMA